MHWIVMRFNQAERDPRDRGSMAVEMALFLFFFSTLFLGAFEVPRYLLLGQKMERASSTMADLVAQIDPAQGNVQAKINDLFIAANRLLDPYDMTTQGRVIVSSLGYNAVTSANKIMWQRKSPGSFEANSGVGVADSVPALPAGFVIREGENVIVAEIFFRYEPLFGAVIYSPKTLYTVSYTRPRFTNLTAVPN